MRNLDFLPIAQLEGFNFLIPSYQRGYKWEPRQVSDLLGDVLEYMSLPPEKAGNAYCIQPLVVGRRHGADAASEAELLQKIKASASVEEARRLISNPELEVIDGQQRLTTLYLILAAAGKGNFYSISYQTRHDSAGFLAALAAGEKDRTGENEDFYHMAQAYDTITAWLSAHAQVKDAFLHTLLHKVKFIWYESHDPNPISVFRRLNDNKISLTDAELIKAMMLHCSSAEDKAVYERAAEWDRYECLLHDDEFWLFAQNDTRYSKPTRIEIIFDIMREHNLLELTDEERADAGTDEHATFRYFYTFFQRGGSADNEAQAAKAWLKARGIIEALVEWYSDRELYHYVGFLIQMRTPIIDIYRDWQATTKPAFMANLKERIRKKIKPCADLGRVYELDGTSKRKALPLLLLHNIEMVIQQNRSLRSASRYQMEAFYRFPFHLYKKEEKKSATNGWEIEHIASNSGDSDDPKSRAIYLESAKAGISDPALIAEIEAFKPDAPAEAFEALRQRIETELKEETWTEEDKNRIWNYALLDSGTNREYHNAVFAFKRLYVINKERGLKTLLQLDTSLKARTESVPGISFVPPATRAVFAKAFTRIPKSLSSWTLQDAKEYRKNIETTLQEFLPPCYGRLASLPDHKREPLLRMSTAELDNYFTVIDKTIALLEYVIHVLEVTEK